LGPEHDVGGGAPRSGALLGSPRRAREDTRIWNLAPPGFEDIVERILYCLV